VSSFFILLIFTATPGLLIVACQRLGWLDKIGVVVLSFVLGIGLSASGLLPLLFDLPPLAAMQSKIAEIAIALALPLLLFPIDVRASFGMARDTLKSLALALLAVIVCSTWGAWLFADKLDHIWQIAGMSVGAYTGGGPNMGAIKTAINGDELIFTTMITYDILISALYMLFVITLAKPIFSRILLPYQGAAASTDRGSEETFRHLADESANSYRALVRQDTLPRTLLALLLSVAVVGIAVGLSGLVPGAMASAIVIILITSLGIALSFIPRVRTLPNSFPLGMYLILVFCFTTGTMTDTGIVTHINGPLFAYISFIIVGSLVIQALLCKLLKIDTDTFLITSSAAIMSVPFIPVIAAALKNREILLPGFAAAIIGYIAGNYLGIGVAFFTRWLVGG
jgi:uncharacterized membrane protein